MTGYKHFSNLERLTNTDEIPIFTGSTQKHNLLELAETAPYRIKLS